MDQGLSTMDYFYEPICITTMRLLLRRNTVICIKYFSTYAGLILFSWCFLLSCPLLAQTGSSKNFNDTATLKPVTVTAFGGSAKWKDAPVALALITKTQLQRFDNKTLVPILNTIAGVRMEERSPGSYRLSIRGSLLRSPFGVRNIKVYWNNIPLTDAGGNTYLNLIDVSQLSSIEIIKGPASSMYGANTGGATLLKSDPLTDGPKNSFNANLETGSFDLLNEQAGFNHHSKNISFNMQQAHLQNSGYRQQSAIRRDVLQGNVKWDISQKEQLSALLFYTNLHYETPGALPKNKWILCQL
jgi:iron complex outermembrane receptor protein